MDDELIALIEADRITHMVHDILRHEFEDVGKKHSARIAVMVAEATTSAIAAYFIGACASLRDDSAGFLDHQFKVMREHADEALAEKRQFVDRAKNEETLKGAKRTGWRVE